MNSPTLHVRLSTSGAITYGVIRLPAREQTVAKHPMVIGVPQNNHADGDLHYKCLTHWDQPARPSYSLPVIHCMHVGSTAQGQLPHCMWINNIDAVDLNNPTLHVQLAPAEPLQMELSDCQQKSHQLPNTPGSMGSPRIIMLVEIHTTSASHTGTSPHGPPARYLSFTACRVNNPGTN